MNDLNERAAGIIDTAADVLKATGWCMGELGQVDISKPNEDGEHCAIGCLAAGAHIRGLLPPDRNRSWGPSWVSLKNRAYQYQVSSFRNAYSVAVRAVFRELPDKYKTIIYDPHTDADREARTPEEMNSAIVEWNDDLGYEDKSKVLRLFRKAARKLRTQ